MSGAYKFWLSYFSITKIDLWDKFFINTEKYFLLLKSIFIDTREIIFNSKESG